MCDALAGGKQGHNPSPEASKFKQILVFWKIEKKQRTSKNNSQEEFEREIT